ncbi:MAG: FAD-dependent oxidoreductase [Acidobacteriota bacterium]|jgi:hypothetical protein|nr:FAD-dependent oxidoreductase [Acidobacteriota bacterium]
MIGYYGSYDVVVCGGGTSGIPAAIAAARAGAKTLLVERVGQLGGQMNYSGPPGFSYAYFYNARREKIVGGFGEETYRRLFDEGHALPTKLQRWRNSYQFSYVDPDWWGLLAYQMIQESGVELMLHALVTDVVREGTAVRGVLAEHPSGRSIVLAKVVIDCTGEGEVSFQAGAETEIIGTDTLEPATVAFTADGVDWARFMDYVRDNIDEFTFAHLCEEYDGLTEGEIKQMVRQCESIEEIGEIMGFLSLKEKAIKTGEWHNFSGIGFFILPREGGVIQAHFQHSSQVGFADCTDVRDLTRVEVEARNQDVVAWKFFKKYVPGFEKAYITRVCPEARIRETRRVMGDYVLTEDDIAEARKFADVIGKSSFPAGAKHVIPGNEATVNGTLTLSNVNRYPKDGGSNDIPYRCLVVKGLDNLLVAGKAISTTRGAHNRFLQQTLVTGQAAGVAAALCARRGLTPRELEADVSELQQVLRGQGAILDGVH